MKILNFFIVCISLFTILFTVDSVVPISTIQNENLGRDLNKEGTFSLYNTTEKETLCFVSGSYPLIGETWNLTINLAHNSSSGLEVEMWGHYLYNLTEWEGTKEFQVAAGENISEIYISHFICDYPAFPAFDIHLTNSTGFAHGTYTLKQIAAGYHIDVGTGDTYISDISAWLVHRNENQTSSSSIDYFSLLEYSISILLFIMVKRKYLK
jgi:hypothetical protein